MFNIYPNYEDIDDLEKSLDLYELIENKKYSDELIGFCYKNREKYFNLFVKYKDLIKIIYPDEFTNLLWCVERLEKTTYMEYILEEHNELYEKLIDTEKYKYTNLIDDLHLIKFLEKYLYYLCDFENLFDLNTKYKRKNLIEYLDSININLSYIIHKSNNLKSVIDFLNMIKKHIKTIIGNN